MTMPFVSRFPYRLPRRFTVNQQCYVGLTLDTLNNEIPAWDAAAPVLVYGWDTGTQQQRGDYTSRQVRRATLFAPPELEVQIRDKFTLDGDDYEVDEINDVTHGFHGWTPGRVVTLVRITPKGVPA